MIILDHKVKCIPNANMFYKKVPQLKMSLLYVAILDVFPSGGSRRTFRMGGTPSK